MRTYLAIPIFALATAAIAATTPTKPTPRTIRFEENLGQTGSSVRFLARGAGQNIYFGGRDVHIEMWAKDAKPGDLSSVVRMTFPGASASARWKASGAQVGAISYHLGDDRSKWIDNAPQHERLILAGLYPGVDAHFYDSKGRLEYDLVLAPGADPTQIRLRFEAEGAVTARDDGSIDVATSAGVLRQHVPRLFQNRGKEQIQLEGRFVEAGKGEFRLVVGDYDPRLELVVDPVLENSTYLGGENEDEIVAVGETFVAGNTSSVAFTGASPAKRRSRDIFLRGVPTNLNGPNHFYQTVVYGGSGDDELLAAAANTISGLARFVLGGTTNSPDFALTGPGSQKVVRDGQYDGFLVTLEFMNNNLYSRSYYSVGGSGDDRITAVAYTNSDVVYAGVTDSPDLPVQSAFQPSLAGGKDAFVGFAVGALPFAEYSWLTYAGGSGDDVATSVALAPTRGLIIVGGETRSSDLPAAGEERGELKGASDGFLLRIESPSTGNRYESTLTGSRYLGGSGEDKVQAVAIQNVSYSWSFVASGTTTSTDFPLADPVFSVHAGESDAFIARFSSSLGLQFSTLIGGSGADAGTAAAMDVTGNFALAGNTRSRDLPVIDPIQAVSGGGQDGFLAHFDRSNVLRQLTYFGGSGEERLNSAAITSAGVRIGGSTTSSDLPLAGTLQRRKGGGTDGFFATIGTAFLNVPEVIYLGKDTATSVSVKGGQDLSGTRFTVRSSDPSMVGLRISSVTAGEVTFQGGGSFGVEGYASSGEATITVTAEGFPVKTIRVLFRPLVIYRSASRMTLTTFNQPVNVSYSLGLMNPETGAIETATGIRQGAPIPAVTWVSSDPTVVAIVPGTYGAMAASPVAPGSARLTLLCETLPVADNSVLDVTVERPGILSDNVTVGKDLHAPLPYSYTSTDAATTSQLKSYVAPKGTIVFRSSDPSRLLLSADAGKAGKESVTFDFSVPGLAVRPLVYLQALTSEGGASVVISSDELASRVEIPIHFDVATLRPIAQYSLSPARAEVTVGSVTQVRPMLCGGECPATQFGGQSPRPGAPVLEYSAASSNADVLAVRNSPTTLSGPTLELRAVAPGDAEVAFSASWPGMRILGPLLFTVQPVRLAAPPEIFVGKDLVAATSYQFPGSTSKLIVSVSDPSKALLSTSASGAGQSTIEVQPGAGFFVHGLGDSGQVALSIVSPGAGEVVGSITLAPSGLAFSTPFVSQQFHSNSQAYLTVGAYWLDDLTGIPIALQNPRPGVRLQGMLKVEGQSIEVADKTFTLDSSTNQISVRYQVRSTGDSIISLLPSDGMGQATLRTSVEVAITNSKITSSLFLFAARDAVTQTSLSLAGSSPNASITVESLDPSRMLLNLGSGSPSGSISVKAGAGFELHGLSAGGYVKLRATAPNADPAELEVPLHEPRIIVSTQTATPVGLLMPGQPAQWSVDYRVPEASGSIRRRPGATPLVVNLSSSNPAVATVKPASIEIGPTTQSSTVSVTPVSPGSTNIVVTATSAVPVSPPRIEVNVGRQKLGLTDFFLGKDLQARVGIRLQSGQTPADNAIVKVTSLTPGLLAVSRSATSPGSDSVTVVLSSGHSPSDFIYLQGLSTGQARVQLTAEGYEESIIEVPVHPAACIVDSSSAMSMFGESFKVQLRIVPVTPGWTNAFDYELSRRPGAGPITVPIEVEDASIVSAAPGPVIIEAGKRSGEAILKAAQIGKTRVRFGVPEGLQDPGEARRTVQVDIQPRRFGSTCASWMPKLGKNMHQVCTFWVLAGTEVRAVSSDESRLVVSFDTAAAGSASATAVSGSQSMALSVQALGSDGTVTVTLSAKGYADETIKVNLVPSGFVLINGWTGQNSTLRLATGASGALGVQLRHLDAFGAVIPESPLPLRPGLTPPRVSISNANPAVASLASEIIVFEAGQTSGQVQIRAVATGSTTIRLVTPEGFTTSTMSSLVVEVQ